MAPKILLRFAAILLLATTVMTRFEQARAQDDPCIEVNEACNADTNCTTCRDAVGSNVAAYEECQLNYGIFDDNQCIIQAAAPCCQNEATSVDCLANAAYTDYYDCRLVNDVGGDCTGLSCDAIGTAILPTTSPTGLGANDEAEEDDDPDEDGAGLLAPSSATGVISAVFVVAGLSAGVMTVL